MYVQRAKEQHGQVIIITQSEQVYSALESEIVMFRLFVLCTFRFRKKYSKRSKKGTLQASAKKLQLHS